ncbi:MAG TPA: Type 1 glutamine amidotransferase-like domain-containing protein, partial [Ktedonobacteraceae bacterium]|nr:Type 1 glutamine amidotransferase-like domain-containing protein [Ktedonobacteraceae bacterium]
MAGYLVLEGGAEFGGKMADPDRQALVLAGGMEVPVRIIPTAAAADNNQVRAGNNGVRWFQDLGARDVFSLPLIDDTSANDPQIADEIRQSRLIYMLGGFPGYLGKTLAGSLSLQAMHEAYEAGAVLAGSSAGAMVLCQYYLDQQTQKPMPDLGFLRNVCVLPHHNTFGKGWAKSLGSKLPGVVLLGIDEQTGLIDDVGEQRLTD